MSDEEFLALMVGSEWRRHPIAPSYFFSKSGHAARVTTRRGKRCATLLKGCECGRGYRAISYPKGCGEYGRIYIHRAVCELFNGPCPDGMECRHLDGFITNNRAENLAWGTPAENSADKERHGTVLRREANPMAKLTYEQVLEMRATRERSGATFGNLARAFGVSTMTAFRAVRGESWK